MTSTLAVIVGLGAGAAGALLATILAPRVGLVARPSSDRWHLRPTPLLGGLGLAAGLVAALAVAWAGDAASGRRALGLAAGVVLAFLVGLLDDARTLGVGGKLAGQVLAAGVTVPLADVRADLGLPAPAEAVATVLLLVAVMNAVNLLDNMDGVAASVACVGAVALAALGAIAGNDDAVLVSLALAGACGGFLALNLPLPRARVFMGDCGSLPLGLALGAACVLATEPGAGTGGAARLLPIAVLFLPALDTTVVVLRRRRMGLPPTRGGRDHLAHRLVTAGASERAALLVLVAAAAVTGGVAVLASHLGLAAGAAAALGAAFVALVPLLARAPAPPAFERRLSSS